MMIFIIQSRAVDLSLCSIIMFYCSPPQHCYDQADQTNKCLPSTPTNTAVKYHIITLTACNCQQFFICQNLFVSFTKLFS